MYCDFIYLARIYRLSSRKASIAQNTVLSFYALNGKIEMLVVKHVIYSRSSTAFDRYKEIPPLHRVECKKFSPRCHLREKADIVDHWLFFFTPKYQF